MYQPEGPDSVDLISWLQCSEPSCLLGAFKKIIILSFIIVLLIFP